MATRNTIAVDGNEAAASVAHRVSEVCAIYPITPSSNMGEFADEWSAYGKKNIWGTVPDVVEMQSEAGAAGAVHGALQGGALTTTFTASQGLLLMIPNMYKIAGELTSFTMHVAARTVAAHALSIFGDHSDVMACRQIGFALLASGSVQEAHDLACIAHAATLEARVPFLHFFDGFRTSHEVRKIEALSDDDLRFMMRDDLVAAHRQRALNPEKPVLRGTAQNPDVFFQAREACNGFYLACPEIVEKTMARFAERTGRSYKLFDYFGHPQAERVIVMMGSGAEVAHETVENLLSRGEKVGVLKVRLFRPFSIKHFTTALPKTVRAIAVLDRCKEPGGVGEPLYLDMVSALREAREAGLSSPAVDPLVIGGRYGLSSKDFNPAQVKAVFDELVRREGPRNHFTVGIVDDVTHTSIPVDADFDIEADERVRSVFFGLGADGTVGANKNSIKIIAEETDNDAQGYFVYDSKKSGAITISHLRFGPGPIRSSYLIKKAGFVACHQFGFLEKYDMLEYAVPGATFLINAPFAREEVWKQLPRKVQEQIVEKKLKLYAIDAYKVAEDTGMGNRINSIMQTCFFAISGVLPRELAIKEIKKAIEKTYGKKGAEVVKRNFASVDQTLENLHEIPVGQPTGTVKMRPTVPAAAPDFVQRVQATIIEGKGDLLPVSAFPVDGTWPTATAQWEKRAIALEIPVWDEKICIQCNKCAFVCPHAAIRAKVYEPAALKGAPDGFKSLDFKGNEFKGKKYTIQVAPEDCTGCSLCVQICPAKDKSNPKHKSIDMAPMPPIREQERANYEFFLSLPDPSRTEVKPDLKGSQFLRPLFEYSGACAGCGETPYIKLMTQLFGDRTIIANATGCSSIYGGNLPTTPYAVNADGRGPAWNNSLFEDNAEFGFGIRLALDKLNDQASSLLARVNGMVGDNLAKALLEADQSSEAGIAAQRERVAALKQALAKAKTPEAQRLLQVADYLVRKNVWIVGGDGWAYDIGYGGLDHVLSTTRDVNVLILDTEVYSNTGGQASKATPTGAAAKFASAGKEVGKKDIGLMAMAYGHVYVARVAFGAKDVQTVKAFQEAESYHGPSMIIAYSHCIAHGYDMMYGCEQQKLAVDSGVWPLYRFDPRRAAQGQPPLQLDSGEPKVAAKQYMRNETRFRMVEKLDPVRFKRLLLSAEKQARQRVAIYKQLSNLIVPQITDAEIEAAAAAAAQVPASAAKN
ncbi:MAG TPA: pyruvate:ferredoxin (flavodoxin) oxidoreductase [Vicinamibacteria bacterium]|nr:pyruvate:ferredoxin (flavodoxin) oxidoreductase [Vicinamibacteria bacterium]